MSCTDPALESLRLEAESVYFKLKARLGNDKIIANKIAPRYQAKAITIYRNLKTFSFRNKKSTQRFVDTGNRVLAELDEHEITAKALLVCGVMESEFSLKEKAKLLINIGIHVVVPQLLISAQDSQFWSFVMLDAEYCDFVICSDIKQDQQLRIDNIAKKNDYEVLDFDYLDEIKAHAIQISINKQLKNNIKRRKYE